MKKILKMIVIIIGAIIALLAGVYAYYGGFSKITFNEIERGGDVLVYENVVGDYKQAATVSDRVYNILLNDYNIETFKGFGIYYDNPANVEKSKMRSEVGCIMETMPDSITVSQIETQFNIKELPQGKYLSIEFPFKGSMSILVGIMRVYPALNKYIERNGLDSEGAIMEIYDVPNKKIIYLKAI